MALSTVSRTTSNASPAPSPHGTSFRIRNLIGAGFHGSRARDGVSVTSTHGREEDQAYFLIGLLGVHMPMMYGEGKNTFPRTSAGSHSND